MSMTGSNSPLRSSTAPGISKSNTKRQMKKKNLADFWRATRYLWPYRRMIVISVFSAFFIGLAMAGGLGSILPVLRLLVSGDTIPNWVNRGIAETRLDVTLASESTSATDLMITHIKPYGVAHDAALRKGTRSRQREAESIPTNCWRNCQIPM